MSASENSRRGTRRSLLKRRAQTLQNRRLVHKCQRKRISLLPHWQQKFGLYTGFSALSFELKRRVSELNFASPTVKRVRQLYAGLGSRRIIFRFRSLRPARGFSFGVLRAPSNASSFCRVGTSRFPLLTTSLIAKAQVTRAYSSLIRNSNL
jgi:hypothetical protein